MTRGLFLMGLALTACQTGPRECWGDCALPGEAVMGMLTEQGTFVEVHDGDDVDLTLPVQGGRVLFVTARVKNFEKQGLTLLGEVRNPDTGALIAQDERKVGFPQAVGDGFGLPDLQITSNAANIAVCPNYLSRDLLDREWLLELTVTDSRQAPVKLSHRVIPRCRHADPSIRAGCRCECFGCYSLGKCAGGAEPTGCDGGG